VSVIDQTRINLTANNFVRADGIPLFKMFLREGVAVVQFYDGDRLRAQCRGDIYVEMPLSEFVARLQVLLDNGDKPP